MAPTRKRENRENQFYNVGVQGRKTGIMLEDRGVRDEHGLEPISGIFSSPEKSPPKRATSSRTRGTVTESESMDIQESPIPDLATSAHLLRNSRTHLPPPKSRSPMKTALGSSPRRQSSMGPRVQTVNTHSSPSRAASHPAVSRRLDFEQEGSSLQETPVLYGSGQRRGKRRDVYEIEQSPSGGTSGLLEESIQEELIAQEDFDMLNGVAEESYIPDIGIDVTAGADVEAESEVVTVAPKQPVKRGRKRKSDALKPEAREEQEEPRSRNHGEASTETQAIQKQGKKAAAALGVQPRRSKRVSELSLEEPSTMLDGSTPASNQTETPPVARKARGRPKTKAQTKEVPPVVEKSKKQKQKQPDKENEEPVFKKPKAVPKRKRQDTEPPQEVHEGGKLVDACGKPLSKADIDQLSTTSAGSRFGRGRHLSVFRELEPDAVARVGRTGRHRVQPINWWKNEAIAYDPHGSMQAIVKNESKEPETRKRRTESKGKRRALSALQEEEDTELEPWEEEDGVFVGIFRDWDVVEKCPTQELLESDIAWAPKGIGSRLADTADSSFKFTKLASAGYNSYFSWGFIELQPDQMKRTKNNRRLHMVFHIQSGAVEAKVHESMFTVHRGGVFHVPRGNTYSIKNVGSTPSRIFFAQAFEPDQEDDN